LTAAQLGPGEDKSKAAVCACLGCLTRPWATSAAERPCMQKPVKHAQRPPAKRGKRKCPASSTHRIHVQLGVVVVMQLCCLLPATEEHRRPYFCQKVETLFGDGRAQGPWPKSQTHGDFGHGRKQPCMHGAQGQQPCVQGTTRLTAGPGPTLQHRPAINLHQGWTQDAA